MSHQNTVFHQLLKPILRQDFECLAKLHHSGQKLRSATRWDQFVAILMSQLSCRQSLRDIQSNLESQQEKLYHLGAKRIDSFLQIFAILSLYFYSVFHFLPVCIVMKHHL